MPLKDKKANAALAARARAARKKSPRFVPPPLPKKKNRRLIDKWEVMARTKKSYPSIWSGMKAGTFPLSVVDGGKVKWFEHEVDAWLDALPRSAFKQGAA